MYTAFQDVEVVTEPGRRMLKILGCEEENDMIVDTERDSLLR